jgi:hypothetical protein
MPGKAQIRKHTASTGISGLLRAFSASASPEKPGALAEMPVGEQACRVVESAAGTPR